MLVQHLPGIFIFPPRVLISAIVWWCHSSGWPEITRQEFPWQHSLLVWMVDGDCVLNNYYGWFGSDIQAGEFLWPLSRGAKACVRDSKHQMFPLSFRSVIILGNMSSCKEKVMLLWGWRVWYISSVWHKSMNLNRDLWIWTEINMSKHRLSV